MQIRPVPMPGGWPVSDHDREACARPLLACGGDITRVFDELALDLEAYVRRIVRIPFFRSAEEHPLFFITGRMDQVAALLNLYTLVFETTDGFNCASWVAYPSQENLDGFLHDAAACSDIEEDFDDIYFWYTSPRSILIATSASEPSLARRALAILDSSSELGAMANAPTSQSGEKLSRGAASFGDKGSVRSFESLIRMSHSPQSSTEFEPADSSQRPSPPRRNPRIRRKSG